MNLVQYIYRRRNGFNVFLALAVLLCFNSCKKYLDAKPDQKLVVPETLTDLQALLDNPFFNNEKSPSWDEASADNYYMLQGDYNALAEFERKAYIWEDFPKDYSNDWSTIYDAIFYSNVALEALEKIEQTDFNKLDWNNIKGSALFYRSLSFHRAVLIFSKAYDESTATQDLGIVLRQTSDFNKPSQRASVQESYEKIVTDLKEASGLLPDLPRHVMRPSKAASFALLARVYLSMRIYDSAYKYSNLSLSIKSDLMDYNVDTDPANILFPIKQFNSEVVFSSTLGTFNYRSISPTRERVDSMLYASYSGDDLRRDVFFLDASLLGSTGKIFQGTYSGTFSDLFVGIATDEVILMRAECNARMGNKDAALKDLNDLMVKRWKNNGTWIPFTTTTASEALELVLKERRKELIFRGLRWMDIKRFNKEGANIVLRRIINGNSYQLNPNELRYALLLPNDIINLTGMPQNPR